MSPEQISICWVCVEAGIGAGLAWPVVWSRHPQGSVSGPVSNYLTVFKSVNFVGVVGILGGIL